MLTNKSKRKQDRNLTLKNKKIKNVNRAKKEEIFCKILMNKLIKPNSNDEKVITTFRNHVIKKIDRPTFQNLLELKEGG